jgi:hypothetical protein
MWIVVWLCQIALVLAQSNTGTCLLRFALVLFLSSLFLVLLLTCMRCRAGTGVASSEDSGNDLVRLIVLILIMVVCLVVRQLLDPRFPYPPSSRSVSQLCLYVRFARCTVEHCAAVLDLEEFERPSA